MYIVYLCIHLVATSISLLGPPITQSLGSFQGSSSVGRSHSAQKFAVSGPLGNTQLQAVGAVGAVGANGSNGNTREVFTRFLELVGGWTLRLFSLKKMSIQGRNWRFLELVGPSKCFFNPCVHWEIGTGVQFPYQTQSIAVPIAFMISQSIMRMCQVQ